MINKQKQKVKTSAEMKHQRNENIPKHPKTKNVNENISENSGGNSWLGNAQNQKKQWKVKRK